MWSMRWDKAAKQGPGGAHWAQGPLKSKQRTQILLMTQNSSDFLVCLDICQPTNGLPRPRTAGKAAPMCPAGTMGTQPARLGHLIGLPKFSGLLSGGGMY